MKRKPQVDKYVFFICLAVSIILFVLGFVTPPPGVIDGSVLTAAGILFGFAGLGVVGQNIANGKELTWRKGDMEISVEDTGCQCQTIEEKTDQ